MAIELPKSYDPAVVEPEANRAWMEEKLFHAEPSAPGEPYCIVIPPPNVTGALHLGHAINDTIQDVLIRQHRMRGFNTVWIPGIDHAGIATQAVVEKQLKEKENKTRHDVGREGLVERIWAWKQQYGDRILEQLKRLGCSCDWDRTRFTLDEQCARAVRETFFKLFKDGLIYRGKRLVNWDTFLQTSISDDEIYHETVKTSLWHIRYPIVDGETGETTEARRHGEKQKEDIGERATAPPGLRASVVSPSSHPTHMTVATTRPETMLGDTAVAVHSQDPRWNWAIGKHVRLPLTNRLIPIIADDILVDPKFGTGVVKVTPAHDPNDYAVWQRHKGQADEIDIINILTPDGRIADDPRWKPYAGMKREAARQKVVDDLKGAGLLEKEEPYETQVGHSDRSKTPIEPYLSDQWFVKMAPLAEPALQVVRDGIIKFFPARFANTYLDWLGEKRDWPISRQLWWGHRIPVWYLPAISGTAIREFDAFERAGRLHSQVMDDGWYVCVRSDADSEVLGKLEAYGFKQDPDVLDTWFSSALWPHSTLGWPDKTPSLEKWYPTSVLVTSRDIITLWVARMVMMGMYNMGAIPFHHVHIHATILDGKGERMSKTKGNGVDPVDVISTHGADALRFTLTQMATETQDARMRVQLVCPHCGNQFDNPEGKLPTVLCPKCKMPMTRPMGTAIGTNEAPIARATSDRFDVGRHFCNKIWQVSLHFAMANLQRIQPEEPDERKWSLADRWIVSRFNRTLEAANAAIDSYRFDQYAKACYDFFWGDFCDWYVEAIKPALKDPERAGQTAAVLAAVVDGALRLMHPMIPFITEVLWWRLNEISPQRGLPGRIECPPSPRLIKAAWPTVGSFSEAAEFLFPKVQEIVTTIRNIRNQYNVSPKQPVTVSIQAPGDAARTLSENRELIELLATCTIHVVQPQMTPPANALHTTAAGCDLYLEGLVDPEAEKKVNSRRCDDLKKQISALRGRLSNESYISKAPPHLVQQTKDQLAEAEAEAGKLGCEVEG